jgi:hypothetical protein
MFEWLNRKGDVSLRKLRLLFAACCRKISGQSRTRTMAAEGQDMDEDFPWTDPNGGPIALAGDTVWFTLAQATEVVLQEAGGGNHEKTSLLRCIFGPLKFRPVAIDPSWRTPGVLGLARAIYDEEAFNEIAVLSDALEEAGCDDPEILGHLRQQGQGHVRGCWALDLVLGKE